MVKLIHGFGVNDYKGPITYINKNGVKSIMPFYSAWSNMIERCYSDEFQSRQPTYKGCEVCDEWASLFAFKVWFDDNYVNDWQLDKDLLVDGNKIYSPELCRYVPRSINSILSNSAATRGKYMQGVSFRGDRGKFRASISIRGKSVHLGYFRDEMSAHNAYMMAKGEYVLSEVAKYRGTVCNDLLNSIEARYK